MACAPERKKIQIIMIRIIPDAGQLEDGNQMPPVAGRDTRPTCPDMSVHCYPVMAGRDTRHHRPKFKDGRSWSTVRGSQLDLDVVRVAEGQYIYGNDRSEVFDLAMRYTF